MAFTLEQIREFALNPASIPAPGTYAEGGIYSVAEMLRGLKSAISKGQLPISEYFAIAEPLVNYAAARTGEVAGKGKGAADIANKGWQEITSLNAVRAQNGQWVTTAPFSAREYANLPVDVLPTQEEVTSGRIPLDLLPPVQRFRPPTPISTPQTPQVLPPIGPGGQQPGTPPGTITQVPDPANPGKMINVPLVGDPLQNSVPKMIDQSVIEQEGLRQSEQNRLAFEAERAIRGQRLKDTAAFLSSEEDRKFGEAQPGIYEDLNKRGLLRSTGLGDALAREKAKLSGESAAVLAQQGLSDRDAEVGGIKDILAKSQQFQTSGLERRFTLEDFNREADMAKALGAQYAPQVKGGKSVLGGILAGAGAGASAGSSMGPVGTGIGAVLGAATGGSKAR